MVRLPINDGTQEAVEVVYMDGGAGIATTYYKYASWIFGGGSGTFGQGASGQTGNGGGTFALASGSGAGSSWISKEYNCTNSSITTRSQGGDGYVEIQPH